MRSIEASIRGPSSGCFSGSLSRGRFFQGQSLHNNFSLAGLLKKHYNLEILVVGVGGEGIQILGEALRGLPSGCSRCGVRFN